MNKNTLKEGWYCQKNYLNLIQIKKMDPNKMHERVLEIQKNIETANAEEQTSMLSELLEIASKIEQSLAEVKIDVDIDNIEIEENEE
jgi:2,3-bisphosphoglycerate-independent phosphoglycerate mutase